MEIVICVSNRFSECLESHLTDTQKKKNGHDLVWPGIFQTLLFITFIDFFF